MRHRAELNRLKALVRNTRSAPEDCPGGVTEVVTVRSGDPTPPVPADAHRCERCGRPHVLFVTEVCIDRNDAGAPVELRQDATGGDWHEHRVLSADELRADELRAWKIPRRSNPHE